MKWTSIDIDLFMKAKEYVDTVVIPLVPMTIGGDVKSTVEMGEYINILAQELEREYKGRMLVLAAFTYFVEEETSNLIERLNFWHEQLVASTVKHVVLLTADPLWKLSEKEIEATLLTVPSISVCETDKKTLESLVKSQIKQIQTIIMSLWQKDK